MLRFAVLEDLPQILAIYAPYVTDTTASFEYAPPSPEVFQDRFLRITTQFPWLVWEESGKILGYAYASAPFQRAAYSWCAEPSVYLHPDAWGRGIAQALYAALEKLLARQGYCLLLVIITQDNRRSLHFHEKAGYQFLAQFPSCGFKHGRWLGVVWMQKQLQIVETPSEFPRPWPEFMQNGEKINDFLDGLPIS